jgi:SAM-dependent methyltransferase
VSALNDPALVRSEYADESRLAVRAAAQEWSTGPSARQVVFEAVAETAPRRVLEIGPGQGELAERIARDLGADVYAVDQSERMVELTRARGVEAVVGDVQNLPFADAQFDCVLAAWVLFHVPDLSRALGEVRRVLRPEGALVTATSSGRTLRELWELLDHSWESSFTAENGEWPLLRHFTVVERRDVRGTLTFPSREDAHRYVAATPTAAHLADRLPYFDGPLEASRHAAVFVCRP